MCALYWNKSLSKRYHFSEKVESLMSFVQSCGNCTDQYLNLSEIARLEKESKEEMNSRIWINMASS